MSPNWRVGGLFRLRVVGALGGGATAGSFLAPQTSLENHRRFPAFSERSAGGLRRSEGDI